MDPGLQAMEFLADSRNQEDLERDVGRQADIILNEQAVAREAKRLEKAEQNRDRLAAQLLDLSDRIAQSRNSVAILTHERNKARLEVQKRTIEDEITMILKRMDDLANEAPDEEAGREPAEASHGKLPTETTREYLIRTGKITPFSKVGLGGAPTLAGAMLNAEEGKEEDETEDVDLSLDTSAPQSHKHLSKPGFNDEKVSETGSDDDFVLSSKKRRLSEQSSRAQKPDGEAGFLPEEAVESDDDFMPPTSHASKKRKRKRTTGNNRATSKDPAELFEGLDDGREDVYQSRLQSWCRKRSAARLKAGDQTADTPDVSEDEMYKQHPTRPDAEFTGDFRIPGDIYPSLFDYQKTGVRWLWELYTQRVGGIVGDEMGLGKTIQVIAFLAGLHYSKKLKNPVIIICPATVMQQWVNEFHRWWPPMRVSILHSSGSGMVDIRHEAEIEEDLDYERFGSVQPQKKRSLGPARKVVEKVVQHGHVLITTYSGLKVYADLLVETEWGCAVLDEGHKIRNPDAAITLYCKELRTAHRIILSGTPIQNNLTELWSLFDFVYPMRLGSLVSFRRRFETPIKFGGYANASSLQIEAATQCAETLKQAITPYLLQRYKVDVAADLPKKTERVLFCKLTATQRELYAAFLDSKEMKSIIAGTRQALYGIDVLRKLCNHPDLVDHKLMSQEMGYGAGAKSGKMQVVKGLLDVWKVNGNKALIFCQTRIMLDILQKFLNELGGFRYKRMDGQTAIADRQTMVDEFNNDPDIHVFLLTTKVGGLGVNLTGADRVIIYDPDWNPSTDMQARERAWRLGQKKPVEIYRLMTAGTIEEKIYHRQIFKQVLTNKILRDPKQRQSFQLKDLHDLFTLAPEAGGATETGSIFKNTEVKFQDKEDGSNSGKQKAPSAGSISGISREEEFHDNAAIETAENGSSSKESSDRVLSAIFSRSGVQSAHEHDAIVASTRTGKKKITADPAIIAREARRIAEEAAKELRDAEKIARTVPAGQATWTGTFGTTGQPAELVRPRLPDRRRQVVPYGQEPKGRDFVPMILDFFHAHNNRCYTKMIIDQFNRHCTDAERTAEFQAILRELAVMSNPSRVGRGRAVWTLREEYR
ncbi:hypothetical protein EJ06DRAFT_516923 [Trichodelitschia bisporula]|uniref:DNA repair and recombination protein RAD26 n=1 Tax=Trichodelitschia bisporula TaxID=703511 RepID=A0A6G1HK79_9PEZI|nr:hypothetical protein EJ06DRAFT_516923 [Trichodelitschia bisporula]